ncbi:phosphate/phosphite/phosphonate ABC transporter substrate-binding protein [Glaciecola siphonariae]|uniref:Phosphate/phosphite/phosphonate ABC transporter substrate-binding protein n=1 Tax=Glaciecola siphonariae TaxID=521012 RepID=A0ABV9LZD5_9ALTE
MNTCTTCTDAVKGSAAVLFRSLRFSVLVLIAVSFSSTLLSAQETRSETKSMPQTLSFGVVPQQSAKKLAATWGPIIAQLSERTGIDIRFETAPNIPAFEARLANKAYDIAYMNPYHYVQFSASAGYKAIAKQIDKQIQGIIVVNADSSITSLEQLNGTKMAFPAPLAFAAALIPQASLRKQGIDFTPVYVKSHDSVYLNVSKGFFEAGGGIVRTLDASPVQVKDHIRVLWKSEGYTPHAVAVSSAMPADIVQIIMRELMLIQDAQLLGAIGFAKPFGPALDADWDMIRDLNIDASTQSSQ